MGKAVWESTGKWIGYYKNLGTNMQNLKRKMDDLHRREEDINTELRSAERPWKRRKREVGGWLEDVQEARLDVSRLEQEAGERNYISHLLLGKRVVEKIQGVVELHDNGIFHDGLLTDAPLPKMLIPTKRFFCKGTSERNFRNVWDCLMDDECRRIGVCGMGGIGKTSLMHQINNWLLNDNHKFERIIWVTVSSAFSITKIQGEIAEKLDLDLSKFRDATERAALLHAVLSEKNKYLLILDDLCKEFALEEVGIPEPTSSNGCKLVITTRSIDVCRRMCCKPIKVEILTEQEAQDLFMSEVNLPTIFSPGVKEIAIKVAKECAQLPLAIVTVAGSMRGVKDIWEWRNALKELISGRKDTGEDDEDVVYKRLKFSYNRLKNKKLQQCFLHCAMYPEDERIHKEELIEYWIAEGLIAQMNSREAMFDEGRTILNKLVNSCLLEESSGLYFVWMHDLIREMALKIVGPRFSVHAGTGIEEVPDEVWDKDPEKVSLMWNYIKVLPSNPPIFHRLTTLLLNANPNLHDIPDSFFSQMPLLMVLNLSWTSIKSLPESLSNLENLQSLLLNGNELLEYVPSLGKLKALKQLDLSSSGIREIPQGIEKLVNLKDLNLSGSRVETFPGYKLVGLVHLQRLLVDLECAKLLAEDLLCLGPLKLLCARFENIEEFTKFTKYEQFSMFENYELFVKDFLISEPQGGGNEISIADVELSRSEVDAMVGSGNLNSLGMRGCDFHDMVSLFDIQSLYDARNLRRLSLESCSGIESVFSSLSSYFSKNLRSVEEKKLSVLPNYRVPCSGVGTPNNISINLKELQIFRIDGIKNIFSVVLLQSFPNLTELSVSKCDEIEEIIIEEEGQNQNHNSSNSITLPNLRELHLWELPRLESIYKGLIVACELETICVIGRHQLRRLPLSPTAAPRLQEIEGHKEWWESLEWDDVRAKTVFEPLFKEIEKN